MTAKSPQITAKSIPELKNRVFTDDQRTFSVADLTVEHLRLQRRTLSRTIKEVASHALSRYAFHLVSEGGIGKIERTVKTKNSQIDSTKPGCIALDLDQPFRWDCADVVMHSISVPKIWILEHWGGADAMHGMMLSWQHACIGGALLEQLHLVEQHVIENDSANAERLLRSIVTTLALAFRRERELASKLCAARQRVTLDMIHCYIDAHLGDADLSVGRVIKHFALSRATVYRWFDKEGGLAAYIRHRRLQHAASLLAKSPQLRVDEAGYDIGFKNASSFSRAFTRAYGINPKSMRVDAGGPGVTIHANGGFANGEG